MKDMKQKSKLLSLILRHDPAKAGLTLGPGGWVMIDDLLAGLKAMRRPMSREVLEAIVADNDKKRFSISEDGLQIRAAQGHSAKVDMGFSPIVSPDVLYHGTVAKFMDAIMAEGLKPMARQHVHLSKDVETASTVGARRGKPVILRIDARGMQESGLVFYRADNGVWLTDKVAPKWIETD